MMSTAPNRAVRTAQRGLAKKSLLCLLFVDYVRQRCDNIVDYVRQMWTTVAWFDPERGA